MKLSQDILFYCLSQQFHGVFTYRVDRNARFKGPRFYNETVDISEHIVIIDAEDIKALNIPWEEANDSLFIIKGDMAICPEIKNFPYIIIKDTVPVQNIFNCLMDVYERFDTWDNMLQCASDKKDGFKKIIDSCILITNETICIMDNEFQYVAYSDFAADQGLIESSDGHDIAMPNYILKEYYSFPNFSEIKKKKAAFFQPFSFGNSILKNLFLKEEYIGRIAVRVYEYNESELRYYSAIFEHLAFYIEQLYGKYQSFWLEENPKNNLRTLLDKCINDESVSTHDWSDIFAEMGWEATNDLQLIQFRFNLRYDKKPYAKHLISDIEDIWKDCLGFNHNGKPLLLVNRTHFEAVEKSSFYQALAYFLRENLLTAGVSRKFQGLNDIKWAFMQTDVVLNLNIDKYQTKWYFKFDDYALKYMLMSCVGKFNNKPELICSDKLQKLKEHDKQKGTEYYKTLYQYFQCRLNASATAKKLYIHRSSFLNRMERIQNLITIDFDNNEEVLYLMLSFQVMKEE